MQASDSHSSSLDGRSQGDSRSAAEPPWDLIAERIDALASAWDATEAGAAPPPMLADFVADLDPAEARCVLLELVKLDMERRGQLGRDPQRVEWYAQQLPSLGPVARLPVDLIYEELQARMVAGSPVYREEVERRFPVQATALLRLLGGLALSGSPTATYFADTIRDGNSPRNPAQPAAPRTTPFAHLQPGDTLDDFQLLTPLGSGAFARVFLARQKSMERLVALKVSTHAGSEPQTLAQLDHPHIVRVYDQRLTTDPPANLLYMEVVSGGTLQDVIARARHAYDGQATGDLLLASVDERLSATGTPIPESSSSRDWIADASWPEIVCRIGAELADGLAYAHGRGVMHRDIKPANVLLSAEARPKLADFNVSYNGGRADENPEDTFGGSLAYMSPEQLEACHPLLGGSPRNVREPSDLYALGVLLWELLCGRRPFRDEQAPAEGGSLLRLQRMIETRRRADFNQLGEQLPPDCPASLRRVLEKCLEADRSKRFASAADLGRALRLCLNPRCWNLLQTPTGALGRFVLKWPVLSGVLAGLIPNALTARFNFVYNKSRLVPDSPLDKQFDAVQLWINIFAFAIGIGGGAWMTVRAVRFVRAEVGQRRSDGSSNVLNFSRLISCLVLALWTVSGLVFPVAVAWNHVEDVGLGFYLHFFTSLALCGFAATAYPYFLITAGIVHYFLPAMIRSGAIAGPRGHDLEQISKFNRLHLGMATLVPLLGVLLIVVFKVRQDWALVAVSAGGMVGVMAVRWLERLIDADAAALSHLQIDERRAGERRSSHRTSGARSTGSSRRR
ncbi:MAG TPA: serine/threonine-protein kinase [Lacipirellulaceae bacterium]|nr:serine/threonine-protein kinase [Lacipirellulaceae bacterium]